MTVHALEIPDAAAQLADWLEGHLVGRDLGELVGELAAANPPAAGDAAAREQSLDGVLAGYAGEVVERGLSAAPREMLQQLLVRPRLLLQLQERVLKAESRYWERRLAASPNPALMAIPTHAASTVKKPSEAISAELPPARPRSPWTMVLACLATAAAVLIGVVSFQYWFPAAGSPGSAVAWGWTDPAVLKNDVSADRYLDRLANAASQWSDQKPSDAQGVATRLGELRQGCSSLILADNKALAADDRRWLQEKCRVWAAKFDEQLVALESGKSPTEVREAVDGTVNKLRDALRERANHVRASHAAVG